MPEAKPHTAVSADHRGAQWAALGIFIYLLWGMEEKNISSSPPITIPEVCGGRFGEMSLAERNLFIFAIPCGLLSLGDALFSFLDGHVGGRFKAGGRYLETKSGSPWKRRTHRRDT